MILSGAGAGHAGGVTGPAIYAKALTVLYPDLLRTNREKVARERQDIKTAAARGPSS
jgi:hypothetical protein